MAHYYGEFSWCLPVPIA
uniref:Uncharacterized protein n=1 Tax=Arundo donax TaxID=35708 RepID=A0A0A9BWJ2_ARUDO